MFKVEILINPINTVHNIQVKTAVDKARDQEAESFEEMLQKAAKEQDKEKLRKLAEIWNQCF